MFQNNSELTFKFFTHFHIFSTRCPHVFKRLRNKEIDQTFAGMDSDTNYPIIFLPKNFSRLKANCEVSDNLLIDVSITSLDTEGNNACIYAGFCIIKHVNNCKVNIQILESYNNDSSNLHIDEVPMIIVDPSQTDQSEVWIDPSRSPYVYNQYDDTQSQDQYSICHQTCTSNITYQQHNTYITKNVYNYNTEAIHYSLPDDNERKKYGKVQNNEMVHQNLDGNPYEDNEFECGVLLSHFPEEILNEKEINDKEERSFVGLKSENGALQQLMSPKIQSISKQQKSILFLGDDSRHGQTIQKIAYSDPNVGCTAHVGDVENEVVVEDTDAVACLKRYQCANCQQIFDQISTFREHMTKHRRTRQNYCPPPVQPAQYTCDQCGKKLKNKQKYEHHIRGHGDPDLECAKCHKVFASKFTLRAHGKIHDRKYTCAYCTKTFAETAEMRAHAAKTHKIFMCNTCDFVSSKHLEFSKHMDIHDDQGTSETELAAFADVLTESNFTSPEHDWLMEDDLTLQDFMKKCDSVNTADSVIAKVMSNDVFSAEKVKRNRKSGKNCDVCLKTFNRISDLKRHLIEHVVRSTMAKTPISQNGSLTMKCEVCHSATFSKIDRYKAHLREHAKLTLYQCTFCDKSFSDSSNFSKHKKIHGATFFQCDLCLRKFNSKKMLTQHMEYHNKNAPLKCNLCNKDFYFKSALNKHNKVAHISGRVSRFRCRFCDRFFKSLKLKWDHEWKVHKVRKMVVDCLMCGAKFRKYAELKQHCHTDHNVEIPPAKKLLCSEQNFDCVYQLG